MKTIERVHFITPDRPSDYHASYVEKACWGGVRWVQLRVKGRAFEEWCALAHEVKGVCQNYGAVFIVNDSAEVAAAVDADGVHVGENDMAAQKVREIVGPNKIIGATANTVETALRHVAAGVDYIGVGPYRFTETKTNLSPVLGSEGVGRICVGLRQSGSSTPVIVVGGILPTDIPAIREAGGYGVAVSSGISGAHDKMAAARSFVDQW
jgi:thiamine-phosphate pyrophosphorylase